MSFFVNLFKILEADINLPKAYFKPRQDTATTKRASPVGGSGDVWGRQSKEEQLADIAKGKIDNTPEGKTIFTNPQKGDFRPVSVVKQYTDNLYIPRTTEYYSKSRPWQRENNGSYNRSSLFSSGISRRSSVPNLFDSVTQNPSSASYYNDLINNSRSGGYPWA